MLRWLHQLKTCSEACSESVMSEAAGGGHFHVVAWLIKNCSKVCINKAANEAAKAGNLPMLQWLHQHSNLPFWTNVINFVASDGHIEVIKWLHEHQFDRCTSYGMGNAAKNGHFHLVRWMHDNLSEIGSTGAMNCAAQGGHLDIMKWLYENRFESCSYEAMYNAARNGRLDIMRWLVEHYPDKCRDDLMEIAAWEGHLDVVRYLDKSTVQRASKWRLSAATSQGWLKALQVLIQNFHHRDGGTLGWLGLNAVSKAFDKVLDQLTSQRATAKCLLWREALKTLELYHRCGFYACVSLMLERALKRGYLPLVQALIGNRRANEKREYVSVAVERSNVVFLRWMLEIGTPVYRESAIQLATESSSGDYVEVAGYLSEGERVQLVCKAVTKNWCKLLLWTLENADFDDENSHQIICNAIQQASNDTVQWLRGNLTNSKASKWCV